MGTEDYMLRQRRFCLSVQTLPFLWATLTGNECITNLTATDLVITFRLITGTFAVEVLLVESSRSTRLDRFGFFTVYYANTGCLSKRMKARLYSYT